MINLYLAWAGWAAAFMLGLVVASLFWTHSPPITNEVTQHCIKCHIEKGILK